MKRWAAAAMLSCCALAARADSSYEIRATRLPDGQKIVIDGKMDEAGWLAAPIIKNWHRTREMGLPAREDTEVRILFDRDNLYFGFHCKDSQPDKVAAYTVQNEGFLHGEDNVTIILDPYLDHRNAYYFWTNLLGVRTDGRIVDDGEAYSTDWQGEWESKGSVVADGWIVEVRIPFNNFKYDDKKELSFGMMLDREATRTQEWSNWTPDGVNSAKVSRYPHLTGLTDIAPRQILTLTPYVGGQLTIPSSSLPAAPGLAQNGFGGTPAGGLDARIDPTTSSRINLTVNPDFAQFDVDQDVLYLNTEERFVPERRAFFLESTHLFIAPIQVFFSRRIAPSLHDHMLGGLEGTGKVGNVAFSVLDTHSLQLRTDGSNTYESVNAGAARFQVDIGKRSQISFLANQRIGDQRFAVVGMDSNIHLFEEWFSQGQFAHSFNPILNQSNDAWHLGIHRFDTTSEYWLDYEDIGKGFLDPLGYIPVIDKRAVRGHAYYDWFTKGSVISRVQVTYDGLWRDTHDGEVSRHRHGLQLQPFLGKDGDKVALALAASWDYNTVTNPGSTELIGFHDRLATLGFILFPNDWQSLNLQALYGKFLGGDLAGVNANLQWKFGPHVVLKASAFYTRSSNIPDGSALIGPEHLSEGYQFGAYAQLRYHFTPDLYTRLTYQKGRIVGIADLNNAEGNVIDAVLAWHYRPGSDLFVVYTEQPYQGRQERRLLTKISFAY
jgi:hypothetical protein